MSFTTPDHSALVELLLLRGYVREDEVAEVLQEPSEEQPEARLLAAGMLTAEDLTLALAEQAGLPAMGLSGLVVADELWALAPQATWVRLRLVPVSKVGDHLVVATSEPFSYEQQDLLARTTGLKPRMVIATQDDIAQHMGHAKGTGPGDAMDMQSVMATGEEGIELASDSGRGEESLESTLETAEQAPVIRMVNVMLIEALRTAASDIHLEAMEKISRLRYRIDGVLLERPAPPRSLHNAIVSRIKILSDLDIAERRRPQDGRFKIKALGKEVDIRVSILPTVHGEKVVMRTLDKTNLAPSLSALGLDTFAYEAMKYAIDQPHGILLVTGPTGSGKTTTLYSCLQDLNSSEVNIVTAEDPVEYQLHGVNQVHVNTQAGLSFASVLRSVLRQDPDIVLVGEIRDGETADIAVKAALTGHLVLSTLHTNDAPGVMARLVDMGVPPFMIASALILAQAQRLFRRLCPKCKTLQTADPVALKANRIDPDFFNGQPIFGPLGCPACNNSGYKGRGAIMEVLPMSNPLREGIMHGATTGALRDIAVSEGMVTLKEAGLRKVRDGLTSIAAVLEVTGGGD